MICEICHEPVGEGIGVHTRRCPACLVNADDEQYTLAHAAATVNNQLLNRILTWYARPKLHKGFAAMSPEKQRAIAAKGGRAAHRKGTAHQWTREEAARAGSKGGTISRGGRGRIDP